MQFVIGLLLLVAGTAIGLDNSLGRTPQMGWNSWNHFRCSVNDSLIRETADAIVKLGLDKVGYKYVNIDDCWAGSRGKDYYVIPDLKAFPDMKGLADYVHSKGLLFGLYSDAGKKTCAGRPGSLGYEVHDATSYAKWGVDYLKYDNCNTDGTKPEVRYPVMRDALNKTGRPIFYSMCDQGTDNPAVWAPKVANSWRTTHDIKDEWKVMISKADANNKVWKYAGPGGWNDPDMLEIGNGGMTTTEYKTHFSLWALMKAPLLMGCDLTKISDDALSIYKNEEVIAINQDPLGVQGNKTKVMGSTEIWSGPLSGGSTVVLLLNRGDSEADITAEWSDVGWDNEIEATVRDLWAHKDLGTVAGKIKATSVPSHGVAMYKITFYRR